MGGDDSYTVVGVTRDTKHYGLDEEMRPGVFLPLGREDWGRMAMVVILLGATTVATLLPARRTARTNPIEALRAD